MSAQVANATTVALLPTAYDILSVYKSEITGVFTTWTSPGYDPKTSHPGSYFTLQQFQTALSVDFTPKSNVNPPTTVRAIVPLLPEFSKLSSTSPTSTTTTPTPTTTNSHAKQSSPSKASTKPNHSNTPASPASASSSSSAVSIHAGKASSNTGLIVGIAVLAALLAIAFVGLAFLLFKQKRRKNALGAYAPANNEKGSSDPAVASLENTISNLENTVRERDAQIRDTQALLLAQGRGNNESQLDDRQLQKDFTKVSQSIADWVLTYFKGFSAAMSPTSETTKLLQTCIPSYQSLSHDSRKKFLVLRALVAELLVEAFDSGEFVGSAPYLDLIDDATTNNVGPDVLAWKAKTVALAADTPRVLAATQASKTSKAHQIDRITSGLASLGPSEIRLRNLRSIVDSFATLAMTLAKQPVPYTLAMQKPGTSFRGEVMEDVLQEHKSDTLVGRKIAGTVFPSVIKSGSSVQSSSRGEVAVFKAQVLV